MLLLILHWFSLSVAFCLAASETVLLRQLFQSKLTQTGSLVPAAQGRIGLRGTKAALLLQRMPSASPVNAPPIPQQPRRYHDLTKVMSIVGRFRLQYLSSTSEFYVLFMAADIVKTLTFAIFHSQLLFSSQQLITNGKNRNSIFGKSFVYLKPLPTPRLNINFWEVDFCVSACVRRHSWDKTFSQEITQK